MAEERTEEELIEALKIWWQENGFVGESGSGKSLTALSIIQLLSSQLSMNGSIHFNGENLCELSSNEMRKKRGKDISMIFQEPMTALNPVQTIGDQVAETITIHRRPQKMKLMKYCFSIILDESRFKVIPDELSGGQRQRISGLQWLCHVNPDF